MPLLQNNDLFTHRIYQGNTEIRRIYLGEYLQWGLYQISYHVAGGRLPGEYITEYVWGINEINLPVVFWANQPYYTKFSGWYEGENYIVAIPAITIDLHKDLELYAKWTQRKYTYSGNYQWTTQEWIPGSGDVPTRNSPPNTSDSPYNWGGSADLSMPNCTWYVYYRAQEAGATPPTGVGWPAACNWIRDTSLGEGWTAIPNETNFQPGDIICYDEYVSGDYGHVAFVEGDRSISGSWWTSGLNRNQTAGQLSDWILTNGSSSTKYRYWHNDRSATSEFGGRIQGVLRYNGWSGGGHYETVTHYGSISEQDLPIQKPPSQPNPPQGVWTQLNKYTYTREYSYVLNNWNDWKNKTSGWDVSGDNWI